MIPSLYIICLLFIVLFIDCEIHLSDCVENKNLVKSDSFNVHKFSDFNDDDVDIQKLFATLNDHIEDDEKNEINEQDSFKINHQNTIKAVAILTGVTTNGIVHFEQTGNDQTHVYGAVQGLSPNGRHGMHVHQFKITNSDCYSAGEHYNPTGSNHGSPQTEESHVGDLGNIYANQRGVAEFDINTERLSLVGKSSVINRSIVVHFNTDDLGKGGNVESTKNGNSGERIACGNIKFVSIKKN